MLKFVPVLAVALLGLAGCSKNDHDDLPAAQAPAASATPGASAVVTPSAEVPGGGVPAPATTPPPGPTGSPLAPPPEALHPTTVKPSRPGRAAPPVGSFRVGWITASVTGGSGNCHSIVTTGGVKYAVYSTESLPLTSGQRIRALLTPGATPVDCGPGKAAKLERLQIAD
jgi:hypothetical protein